MRMHTPFRLKFGFWLVWRRLYIAFVLGACLEMASKQLLSIEFDCQDSVEARCEKIAPALNACIEEFETMGGEGADAWSARVVEHLKATGMCKRVWMDVEGIAVHPENREGAMLIAVDVHDLCLEIVTRAWSFDKCSILACSMPKGTLGDAWIQKNLDVVKDSDGLLAPYNASMVKCFTARGSHTTAVVRCIKYASKGVHSELCGDDGHMSRAKIVERQPSMAQPLERGVPVDLVEGELAVACPKLMSVLSRVDNAHGVGRVQTTLQNCFRIYRLLLTMPHATEDQIIKQACIGRTSKYVEDAKCLLPFVRAWAGGEAMSILTQVEAYEKTLKVKRMIHPVDLKSFAKVDALELEAFIPSMLKAMLNSPPEFTDNLSYSTLFPAKGADLASIVSSGGKNRTHAVAANRLIVAANKFLRAYGHRLGPTEQTKLASDLEVRAVMHVFGKRSASRTEYHSLSFIAAAMYIDAKALDPLLPKWTKLDKVAAASKSDDKSDGTGLREIRTDGTITDVELVHRGFAVGTKIMHDEETDKRTFELKAFDSALVNVTIQLDEAASEELGDGDAFDIPRVDLLKHWHAKIEVVEELFDLGASQVSMDSDMLRDIHCGYIKAALRCAFNKSSVDAHCTIRKDPRVGLLVNKDFPTSSFMLVALSKNVSVMDGAKFKATPKMVSLGECFNHDGASMIGVVRSHMAFPQKQHKADTAHKDVNQFLVAYWAAVCNETYEPAKANASRSFIEVSVKVAASSRGTLNEGGASTNNIKVQVPVLINTKPLVAGDEIIVMKDIAEQAPEIEDAAPPSKSRRVEGSKGGRGKGSGKR